MITQFSRTVRLVVALSALGAASQAAAQQGRVFGVTANGTLFRFNLGAPAAATTVGNMGIVPEGIDFRPTTTAGDPTRPLYAIDVGTTTTQLYTVNTATAAVTPVGPGFPSMAAGSYDLRGERIGFDINPTTLQGDGSILIRVIATNGANLRINSDSGLLVNADSSLLYDNGDAPFADAAAYTNSNIAVSPASGGTTKLFDMDARSDRLSNQSPANAGTLIPVGSFGVGVDANPGIAFDILTDANDADQTEGGDYGYAAFTRSATAGGAYLFYSVNLLTGATTNGALVGGGLDFTGGMAITYIPEPSTLVLGLATVFGLVGCARRWR